ncbi:MAG: putative DNA binding domain-containing protein [Chloroflexota bacterium]|nr:putative DNA binding domain-containing protein [Chloroflexota bacterium]MDE2683664.1 putative DNA binding domain-containing protein [Chloroflexota bacterium]
MVSLADSDLLHLIDYGEADRVEFKETLSRSGANEIREAICAFANDLPDHRVPGLVVIGVRDPDRCIVGTEVSDEMLRNLADMKTDGNILPLPSIQVEKKTLRDRDVAVVTVLPSDSPPVRYRGRIQIRIGPRRGIATAQDERILNERRRFGDRPFDLQPVPTAGLRDLNLVQFENEYLPRAFSDDVLTANDRTIEERLAATKMIAAADSPIATVMGLLVIGKSPQDFLPGAYLQFLRIDGLELSDNIIDSETIGGDVSDVLRRLGDKLQAHNRIGVDITSSPTELRTELYPLGALQQITRNAVMHRTYEATNAPIRVNWFNDRIEVISPGGPYGTVNTDNFGQPGLTDYRNPNLADAMRTVGFVQRFGAGIPIAKRQLRDAGHPEPEFTVQANYVSVIIKVAQE